MRILVLMRHGRTSWNAAKRIQGQLDPGLDETGHAQAEAAAPAIAKLEPSVLWSSDLARARETTAYVADATGLTASYDARLRETCLGERQGLTHDEYRALDPGEFARFKAGLWDGIPGAETGTEVAARTTAALAELAAELAPGETGVAVTHGAAIRITTAALLRWPLDRARDLKGLHNCAWAQLEEHDDGWVLVAYNRTA